MSFAVTALRRSIWLLLIGAVGGVAWSWWSDRNAPPSPKAPPEWPPLDTQTATDAIPTATPAPAAVPEPASASEQRVATAASTSSGSASIVNALVDAPEVDAPEARSTAADGGWVDAADDGSCPISHPVKANDNSGIFHVPGGRFYDRTNPERCYSTAEAATADGYRRAKN